MAMLRCCDYIRSSMFNKPLARSNTVRNKPRSPAPPLKPATPRPFLPPSHYAAAGGFSTSLLNRPGEQSDLVGSRSRRQDHAPRISSKNAVPISRTPQLSDSESSAEINSVEHFHTIPVDRMPSVSSYFDDGQREHHGKQRKRMPEPMTTPTQHNFPTKSANPLSRHRYSPIAKELITPNFAQLYSNQSTPTVWNHSSPAKSPVKSALKSSLRSPKLFTPDTSASKSFQSNIPRPRTKLNGSSRGNDPVFEGRYETGPRDKRKSTVTKAEVSVSGSESDVDPNQDFNSDIKMHRGRTTVPTNYRSENAVGLGLSFPHSSKKEVNSTDRRPAANVREDTFLFHSAVQEKTLRFSLPASESVESAYSDNATYRRESFRKSYGTGDLEADHAKRRAAFMDIISDLGDLEVSPSQSFKARHDLTDLASQHFRNSPTSTKKEESMNHDPGIKRQERESRFVRRQQKERRRSSSWTPKILDSPEDDEHVPIVPPRSRSACQRHASPISRPSPKSLRDLIKNRNSDSRSPVPQKIIAPPNIPHRPTFYKQNSPIDRSGEDEGYSDSTDDFQSQAHYAHHRQASGSTLTEASSIAQRYRSAAARERSAFGIPPSESDEFPYNAEHQQLLSHADSDLSFLSESVWQDNCDELSKGAESLFRQLSSASAKGASRKNYQIYGIPPRLSVISPTLSTSSTYEDQLAQHHKHGVVENHSETFKGHPGPDIPAKDIPVFDSSQKNFTTREAVIQEIFVTEEYLLRLLHICMQQFILPLRVESSRSWITGVPRNIARLLDWLDDIVNLHEQIYQSLCSARDTQSPTTDRVSESLRCFVLKAEVYQPYLIRLPDVSEEISFLMTGSGESDFGQFVNLQEQTPECEGWSFQGLLMLPVHRLSAYQTLFSRMLELTPKTHQDYLSTFSLSRSTDLVIKVMTEVKIRENEYNLIKRFSTRIQGLSASSQLATRDRRLLHSGPLGLVVSDRGPNPRAKRNSGSGNKSTAESKRSSKLADNICDWAYHVEKSGSVKSRKSSNSVKPSTPFGSAPPPSPNTAAKSSWFSRLPLRKRSRSKATLSGKEAASAGDILQSVVDVSSQCIPIHAFVFNDLVLLVQSKSPSDDDPLWVLIQDVGVIKPLSIAQIAPQNPEGNIVLSLEAITLDANQFDENTEFRSSPLQVVDLVIPRMLPGDSDDSNKMNSSPETSMAIEPWLLALRQCSQSTLRRLIFPGYQDTCSDQLVDAHLAISSLIGSGLPMPRSPSGQFAQIGGGTEESSRFLGDEREERGWWSLRYQQVFREFQRQDSFHSDVDVETP